MGIREDILKADDLGYEDVDVTEWGETIRVRGLTAGEAERFGKEITQGDADDVMARLLVRVLTSLDGKRIFADEDAEALSGKNAKVIRRLFDKAQELSGVDEDLAGN